MDTNLKKRRKHKKNRLQKRAVDVRDTNRYQHWQARVALLGCMLTYSPQARADFEVMMKTKNPHDAAEEFIQRLTSRGAAYIPFRQPELTKVLQNPTKGACENTL